MAQHYSDTQKAEALARVLSGESVTRVARDMEIGRTCIQNWLVRQKRPVTTVVTGSTLQGELAVFLHESLVTLTKHAQHYRSDAWLKEKPAIVMESTRTLGSRFTAIMDRLGGRTSDDGDAD